MDYRLQELRMSYYEYEKFATDVSNYINVLEKLSTPINEAMLELKDSYLYDDVVADNETLPTNLTKINNLINKLKLKILPAINQKKTQIENEMRELERMIMASQIGY